MKYFYCAIIVVAIIISGIVAINFINRDRVQLPTAEEIFATDCSKRGGNVKMRVGWDNEIHINESICEVTK